jgi:hypothetical protein
MGTPTRENNPPPTTKDIMVINKNDSMVEMGAGEIDDLDDDEEIQISVVDNQVK